MLTYRSVTFTAEFPVFHSCTEGNINLSVLILRKSCVMSQFFLNYFSWMFCSCAAHTRVPSLSLPPFLPLISTMHLQDKETFHMQTAKKCYSTHSFFLHRLSDPHAYVRTIRALLPSLLLKILLPYTPSHRCITVEEQRQRAA